MGGRPRCVDCGRFLRKGRWDITICASCQFKRAIKRPTFSHVCVHYDPVYGPRVALVDWPMRMWDSDERGWRTFGTNAPSWCMCGGGVYQIDRPRREWGRFGRV